MEVDVKTPVLSIREGSVVTNSRDVAVYFEKRHDHVIRDIRHLLNEAPEVVPNFGEFKINDLTGLSTSHFEMNRDGFTLLAMGFTGPKALKFKLAYIAQFNAMEDELRSIDEPKITAIVPESISLRIVSEGRRLWNNKVGQQLWVQMGLPIVSAMLVTGQHHQVAHDLFSAAANQNLPKAA